MERSNDLILDECGVLLTDLQTHSAPEIKKCQKSDLGVSFLANWPLGMCYQHIISQKLDFSTPVEKSNIQREAKYFFGPRVNLSSSLPQVRFLPLFDFRRTVESDSIIANVCPSDVCLSVHPLLKPLSLSESYLFAIMCILNDPMTYWLTKWLK